MNIELVFPKEGNRIGAVYKNVRGDVARGKELYAPRDIRELLEALMDADCIVPMEDTEDFRKFLVHIKE